MCYAPNSALAKKHLLRLEFVEFRSKLVNRPTSEAQPQKKHGNRKPKLVLLEFGAKKERTRLKRTHRT